MGLDRYRRVLALPGVRTLMVFALVARVPVIAASMTLTLHVLLDLHRGYAAAGLVAAASTIGTALGAPLLGRLVDRRGLRTMLVVTTLAEAAFWLAVPVLPYLVLVVAAFVGGLLTLPVFSVVRQSLAALVPEAHRRQGYSLDSMSVEISYMAGPALAVLIVTQVSTTAAIATVGGAIVLAGVGFYVLNPPVRADDETPHPDAPPAPRRTWLRGELIGILLIAAGSTLILAGSEVAVIAVLRGSGQVVWTGLVLAAWGLFSLVGGFIHGALRRALSPLALMALLGALSIPIGLVGDRWWLLVAGLLPAGLLCAPTLASTSDAISRLVPATSRGEAMGLQASALTTGWAIGAPLVGAVVDHARPVWGFVVAGTAGVLVAAAALFLRSRRARPPTTTPSTDAAASAQTA